MTRTVDDRLFGRTITNEFGCMVWQGCINSRGYGVIGFEAKRVLTHRLAYELRVGPIPDGLQIDHLCRNRRCINPGHIEPVTGKENQQRRPDVNKTHCVHGHELTDANTIIKKRRDGGTIRNCRTCNNAQQRARAWAKRHLDRDLTAAELAEFCVRAA